MPSPSPFPDLLHDLRAAGIEARDDLPTRILYSTDASIYQIEPLGVVFPRQADELQAIAAACARYDVALLARGAGSSLGGQAIGPALIVDCARHLNRLIEIDPEQQTALAEPGIVLNTLNRAAARHGLTFGPDPASAERATLGGSLANNAAGAHSIIYGMCADHLLAAEVALSDGSLAVWEEVEIPPSSPAPPPIGERGEFALPPRSAGEMGELAFSPYPAGERRGFALPPRPAGERGAGGARGCNEAIFAAALRIRAEYGEAIRAGWPRVWRRASGYNLNYLLPWSPGQPPFWGAGNYPPVGAGRINLAHLLAGSEGTLAVMRRLTVRLSRLPEHTLLAIYPFASLAEAADAAPLALQAGPSAVELIPGVLIRLARSVPAYAAQLSLFNDLSAPGAEPPAILAVEFSADAPASLKARAQTLQGVLGSEMLLAETKAAQAQVWTVRKVGLGLIMSRPGDWRPYSFIEDLAVPVERLGEFVRGVERILDEHGVQGENYGHASAGCLHIRPIINLKTATGVQQLRSLAEAAVDLTLSLGGAVSGEHGDGLARSEWYERMFGGQIVAAMQELKRAADPHNLLNPGKMVGPEAGGPPRMDENLRFGSGYRSRGWATSLDFGGGALRVADRVGRLEGGAGGSAAGQGSAAGRPGLEAAIEQCNGAGVCRKVEGTMCPSFQATQEELYSTRGRANLLRALISGRFPSAGEGERAVYEALDLCLACKGCKAECPSSVDVAKLKYAFWEHYYETHRRKLRDYLFGYIGPIARLTHRFAALVNPFLRAGWFRREFERLLGVSAQRQFPEFAIDGLDGLMRVANTPLSKPTIAKEISSQSNQKTPDPGQEALARREAFPPANSECGFGCSNPYNPFYTLNRRNSTFGPDRVLYLPDAFTTYMNPQVGQAGVSLLRAAGCRVVCLPVMGAGRTLISKGFLPAAKKQAERLLRAIDLADGGGALPVVGVEPSEIHALLDEYLDFFPGDEAVQALARRAWTVEEFLLRPDASGAARLERLRQRGISGAGQRVLLHGHCYQKARPLAEDGLPVGVPASLRFLEALGYSVSVVDDGCCGMAGAFGYESEHYDLSMQVGELALFPAVRAAGREAIIAAAGVSCREQIRDGAGRVALHPVEVALGARTVL